MSVCRNNTFKSPTNPEAFPSFEIPPHFPPSLGGAISYEKFKDIAISSSRRI